MGTTADQFSDDGRPERSETAADCDLSAQQLVTDHYADVYRFAFRLSGSQPEAEDLTQQTFLTACRKLHQIRDFRKARSWLLTIVRNHYLKSRSRQEAITTAFEDGFEPTGEFPDVNLHIDEEALQAALSELPEAYRTPILFYFFEDLGYQEIAELLDVPIGTVMSRLSRAKQHLRRKLGSQNEGRS